MLGDHQVFFFFVGKRRVNNFDGSTYRWVGGVAFCVCES